MENADASFGTIIVLQTVMLIMPKRVMQGDNILVAP